MYQHAPVVPATWEAEAEESLETWEAEVAVSRDHATHCTPAWATEQDSVSKNKTKPENQKKNKRKMISPILVSRSFSMKRYRNPLQKGIY